MFTYLDDRGSSRYSRAAVAASRRAALAMTTIIVLLLVSLYACGDRAPFTAPSALATSASLGAPAAAVNAIPGQYIVTFNRDVSDVPGLANQLVAQSGGQQLFTYTAALRGFAARMSPQAAHALQSNPHVAQVEQDQSVATAGTEVNSPYGLDRIDQRALPLDGSYSYNAIGGGVTIYIMDSGVRTTHVDFAGRAGGGYSVIADGRGTGDCTGHGTLVAGIAGSTTYGVAKAASLVPVRVFDCTGAATYSGIVSAVDWVTQNAARPAVVNMSFSGPASAALTTAVQSSIAAGITYVAASGNNGADACTYAPGNIGGVINVGSSSLNDLQTSYSNGGACVTLFAPGASILSTAFTSDTATQLANGTSMAAPHVAGAAALFLQGHPTASPQAVKQAIVSAATMGALSGLSANSPNLLLYTPSLGSPDSSSSTVAAPAPGPTTVIAALSVNCSKAACRADASGSSPAASITTYNFSFGDGTSQTSSTSVVQHKYGSPGSYTVAVTASAGSSSASASAVAKVRKM